MSKIKVGITHGDTNGIGYEVILKTLEDNRLADLCTIVVYGSAKAASFYRKAMELPQVQFTRTDSAAVAGVGSRRRRRSGRPRGRRGRPPRRQH